MELQNQNISNGMKALNISTDKNLFKENSEVLKRMIDHGNLVEELHIIVLTQNLKFKIQNFGNIFIYPTNSRSKLFYVFDAYKIAKPIIRSSRNNFLVTCQDPFEAGLIGWLIKRKFKIPLQLQIHTDFLSPYFLKESLLNKARVLLARLLIPRANCVRVVSKRIKNSLKNKSHKLKVNITVLPIFVNVKKIQEAPIIINLREKYPQFDFVILMASRLTKEKNIGLAIDGFSEVLKQYPKTGLIIVGDGPELNNLKSVSQNLKIDKQIIFEEWKNQDILISYYKTADLFLFTSNYEGYGMTVVEAMAAGCPVLMTDVGIANEILINKKDGLVVSVNSKQELIKAILTLISNDELRKNFVINSNKIINLWPSYNEHLKNYYDSWMFCAEK